MGTTLTDGGGGIVVAIPISTLNVIFKLVRELHVCVFVCADMNKIIEQS